MVLDWGDGTAGSPVNTRWQVVSGQSSDSLLGGSLLFKAGHLFFEFLVAHVGKLVQSDGEVLLGGVDAVDVVVVLSEDGKSVGFLGGGTVGSAVGSFPSGPGGLDWVDGKKSWLGGLFVGEVGDSSDDG